MNILVIPEDFRKDQYILKPIIEAMISDLNKRAKVEVCKDPLLGGVGQALKWNRIKEIIDRYKWKVNLFLLCVDRDGDETRINKLDSLVNHAPKCLLAQNAWQELEVWVLAGQSDLPREWNWEKIRQELNPKEIYYIPYVKQKKLLDSLAQGRKSLSQKAAKEFNRIKKLCPEILEFQNNIGLWIDSNKA